MDSSAPAAQDVRDQTPVAKPVTSPATDQNVPHSNDQAQNTSTQAVQSTQATPVQAPQKTQISVSGGGGLEAGSAVIVEDADDEDDEEELQVAPQEKKNLGVMGQGADDEQGDEQQIVSQQAVVDVSEEVAEVQPAVPEVVAGSPEVEKLVEITEREGPKITEKLKTIGVTHSGPGVIDDEQAAVIPAKIPITFDQVLTEEAKIKNNRLHSSKFWLLEKIKYLWRKVNPNIAMTVKQQPANKLASVNTLPVKTDQTKPLQAKNEELKAA